MPDDGVLYITIAPSFARHLEPQQKLLNNLSTHVRMVEASMISKQRWG